MLRLGLLIPQFPSQTHIAMWRVGHAMRELGADVRFISTRRPEARERCHRVLEDESTRTFYAWPPAPGSLAAECVRALPHAHRGIGYYASLRESSLRERAALAPLLLSALNLRAFARREGLRHIFVHSCANAAHLVALCHRLGGPSYSLRLGGDIEVYGKDQRSKMARASFILAAARVNVEQIREQVGLPDDRLLWSWLGVDTRRFRPPAEADRQQRKDPAFHAVSVGRVHRAKGHIHALRAMRRLVHDEGLDLRYTIGGSGPGEAEVRQHIGELGLTDRVTLIGALDEERVIATLQSADVFLLPSVGRGEASPVAVIEAMACGVPVIASIIGGTGDMVTDGVDGFLTPMGDEGAIAGAWRRIATEPALHARLAASARARAEKDFDCRQIGRKVLDRVALELGIPMHVPDVSEDGRAAVPRPLPARSPARRRPEGAAGPTTETEEVAVQATVPGGNGSA